MILLFDSSDMTIHTTLIDGEKTYEYHWDAGRTLARDMLAYVRDTLKSHDATFDSLTGIGVNKGPGSYTGLRIGLTVLNTLAEAKNIPIVGASGSEWAHTCTERLAAGENDAVVMPDYGGEAHVTAPRK